MSPLKRSALVLALASALAVPVVARAPITIRLATVVPAGSSWDKALRDMGAEWDTKTSGRVKLTVYPEAQHDSWTETYDNLALYDWFLQHDLKSNAEKGKAAAATEKRTAKN